MDTISHNVSIIGLLDFNGGCLEFGNFTDMLCFLTTVRNREAFYAKLYAQQPDL